MTRIRLPSIVEKNHAAFKKAASRRPEKSDLAGNLKRGLLATAFTAAVAFGALAPLPPALAVLVVVAATCTMLAIYGNVPWGAPKHEPRRPVRHG